METEVDSVQTNASGAPAENDDKVAYSTYKRVLAEAKKFKELADSLSKQTEQEKEAKLKEQNEWKSLAEMHKAKLDLAQKELEEKNRAIQDGTKYTEFVRHLGGKLRHDSYVNHVDFDKILINPETGRVEESSVKTVVAEFVKEHASLVDFGINGRMPNNAPRQVGPAHKKSLDEMDSKELEKHILEQAKLGLIK